MATVAAIGNVNSDFTPAKESRIPVQKLGQEDFIKILVAQLTTQDPMNPQKDTEFIGQMAQFSALESSKQMQQELETLRAQQEFAKANSVIGRSIELIDEDDNNIVGVVSSVEVIKGQAHVVVDEKAYPMEQVVRVWQNGGQVFTPSQQEAPPAQPVKTPKAVE